MTTVEETCMHISACLLEGAVTTASLLCIRSSGAWGGGEAYTTAGLTAAV